MTTATRPRSAKRKPAADRTLTLGPVIVAWMEDNLVHAEGDYLGQDFELRKWQRDFLRKAYALNLDGSRRYRRALLGLPKGNGKTELAAAIAVAEFIGPVVCAGFDQDGRPIGKQRLSPDIPIAAASFEQADELYRAAKTMVELGPLADIIDTFDTEMGFRDGIRGRLYRVAAKAGTNDGKKPSFFVADELHEWQCTCATSDDVHRGACKARVHTVLSNGRAKRAGAWELNISTAGWDMTSLLGKMYQEGKHIVDDGEPEDGFLFEWHEPTLEKDEQGKVVEIDLEDPVALEKAIREANPAAGDFLPIEGVLANIRDKAEHVARRYHLNQWTSAPERWLESGLFEGRADPEREVPDGARIVIGFDGSWAKDSTAVVGCTIPDRHLFVIEHWESDGSKDWRVDTLDVKETIREACRRYDVAQVGCDPHRWSEQLQTLQQEGLPIIDWPSHSVTTMVPACSQFEDGLRSGQVTHDGDERLVRHVANCVMKIDSRGSRIVKEQRNSPRRIDLAVAAVIADDLVNRQPAELDGLGVDF